MRRSTLVAAAATPQVEQFVVLRPHRLHVLVSARAANPLLPQRRVADRRIVTAHKACERRGEREIAEYGVVGVRCGIWPLDALRRSF